MTDFNQRNIIVKISVHKSRHFIVDHVTVFQNAVLIDHLFKQRVSQSHGQCPFDLLRAAERVDRLAHIVCGANLDNINMTCTQIDSNFRGLRSHHPHDGRSLRCVCILIDRIKHIFGAVAADRNHGRFLVHGTARADIIDV